MISELKITTGNRSGRTFLQEGYCTRPFKLVNISHNRADPALYLMLMTASPGMLDGDHYRWFVTVTEGARLHLQTQAYQRLYNMQSGACQHTEVRLLPGSAFSYVPHPVVPHTNARYEGHARIHLAEGCRLIWGEVITCGRKLSGEAFQYSYLHNVTELYYKGRLLLKDNLLLQPSLIPVQAPGQLEGFTHQATLIYAHTGNGVQQAAAELYALLEHEAGIAYGLSQAAGPALVLRMLGNGAEQLFNCLRNMEKLLWTTTNY